MLKLPPDAILLTEEADINLRNSHCFSQQITKHIHRVQFQLQICSGHRGQLLEEVGGAAHATSLNPAGGSYHVAGEGWVRTPTYFL